jgi:hypothetical protein
MTKIYQLFHFSKKEHLPHENAERFKFGAIGTDETRDLTVAQGFAIKHFEVSQL